MRYARSLPLAGTALILALAATIIPGPAVTAAAPKTAAPLADAARWVPPDAFGFVRVRVPAFWQTISSTEQRQVYHRVEKEAKAWMQAKFGINLADLSEVWLILPTPVHAQTLWPGGDPMGQSAVWLLRTSRPIARADFEKSLRQGRPIERKVGTQALFIDDGNWLAVTLADDQTVLMGSEESVTGLLAKERSGGDGPMAESLAATATTAMFVAGLNLEQLRAMAPESELPPDLRGLHKTQTVSLRVDRSEAGWQAQLSLSFANEADADAGLNAARKLLEMGRAAVATALQEVDGVRNQRQVETPFLLSSLLGLAWLREADDQLAKLKLDRKGSRLEVDLSRAANMAFGGADIMMALAAISTLGTRAQGTFESVGATIGGADSEAEDPKLDRLYQAIIRYRDEHGHFPPAASLSPEGEPLLSWRVLILPQLGEEGLYKQFKLDEPWHSPHNKRLLARKPAAYGREFNRGERSRMLTPYVTGMGPGVILDARHQTKEADLKAGPSVIALLVERTGFDEGVLWTKPEDLDLASEQPLVDALVPTWHHSFKVLFADGKVRKLRKEGMDDRKLRALFRRDHQEKVEWKD